MKIKIIYHYVKTINFRDNRVKTRHPSEYFGEKIQFKWSDNAHYILRLLVGLVRLGRIDTLLIRALYWQRTKSIKSGFELLIQSMNIF